MNRCELLVWRQKRGLSQQKAADLIGCSKRAWQAWESGERDAPRYIELALREATRILEAREIS